jgi:hypothetical protein
VVLLLSIVLLVGGCAGTDSFEGTRTLDTKSGFPEIRFESVHVTQDDLTGVLINYYLDKGYRVRDRSDGTIVLYGPVQESSFSRFRIRKIFNFIRTRNQLRIVAQAQRLELPLSGSSQVQDVVNLPPGGDVGRTLQEDLNEIGSTLVDQDAFQNLEGAEQGSTSTNESDTSTTTD